jgi:hypothetical protein
MQWVSCNNPFYAISALLVCLGLWVSFGGQAQAAQTWALMGGMTGYTLLLAVTACLLVRLLGVWDDVRTVLLLTVLMFLATSVTFDEVLAVAPERGIACFVAGLAFACAVSEGMLRGVRLKLPASFRVPYYLILVLFYIYPVALVPLLDRPGDERLEWALFGFSPAAGLVALTLLPAIRRGRRLVRDNGSPWPWAWYPWTLFGVLGFGIMARSALLCWSMHHLESGAAEPYIFGPYFLVPFLFAVALLLLEIGLVEQKKTVLAVAMTLPALLCVLTLLGHRSEPVYQAFLAHFTHRLGGSPLYLTLVAAVAFYAFAWWRRVPKATGAMTAALLCLAFVEPSTRSLGDLAAPRFLPLLLVGALQLTLGITWRDSWACALGAGCLIVAGLTARVGGEPAPYRFPIGFHALLLSVLALGAAFDDTRGRRLRDAGAALTFLACLASLLGAGGNGIAGIPPWIPWVYSPVMCVLLAVYGKWLEHAFSRNVAVGALACWFVAMGTQAYRWLRQLVAGLDYIALGMAFFVLAWLTSLFKGGKLSSGIASAAGKVEQTFD